MLCKAVRAILALNSAFDSALLLQGSIPVPQVQYYYCFQSQTHHQPLCIVPSNIFSLEDFSLGSSVLQFYI